MPGIAWHGLWITWYDEEKLKMVGYRVNQISVDGTEDAEAVAQNVTVAVKNHVCKHTRHKYFVLDTDGAGAYAGSELMARLGFMLPDCDVRIIEHCIGEPGGGKSTLDAGYGTDKYLCYAMIRISLTVECMIALMNIVIIMPTYPVSTFPTTISIVMHVTK